MIIILPNMRIDDTDMCVWNEEASCSERGIVQPRWVTNDGHMVPLTWGDTGKALRFCDTHLSAFLGLQQLAARAAADWRLEETKSALFGALS